MPQGYTAIVDYGIGNVGSITNILKKIGAASVLTADPDVLRKSDRLILPGVGAFDAGMRQLRDRGLVSMLNEIVVGERKPILGLCLGMQLLGKASAEGDEAGLGWLDCAAEAFPRSELRVPHMGWNTVSPPRPHALLDGLSEGRFYFVHSYRMVCADPSDVVGMTTYGDAFASVIGRGTIFGVQFHPEKSHRFGMRLFQNYVAMTPGATC